LVALRHHLELVQILHLQIKKHGAMQLIDVSHHKRPNPFTLLYPSAL